MARTAKSLMKIRNNGIDILDADTFDFQTGISATANGSVATVVVNTSSLSPQTVTGTIDDSNVTFTTATLPTLLNINGAFYQKTGGSITWSYSGTTITLSSPVGTGGSIFAV